MEKIEMEELKRLIEFEDDCIYLEVSIEVKCKLFNFKEWRGIDIDKYLEKLELQIYIEDKVYRTKLDRIFIHQIGSRIDWTRVLNENELCDDYSGCDTTNSIKEIYENLEKLVIKEDWVKNFESLVERIFIHAALQSKNLVIIYYTENAENWIYGIVSKFFKPTNQLEFRNEFIKICNSDNSNRIDTSRSKIKYHETLNIVEEIFYFNKMFSRDFALGCCLTYGKNNGYGSYSISWVRVILGKEKLQLTKFIKDIRYNWRNNPRFVNGVNQDLKSFVETVVKEGISHQIFLEKIIEMNKISIESKAKFFHHFHKILDRIKVANSSKERVVKWWTLNFQEDPLALTNWAIIQSLLFIGTKEKAVPKTMQSLLRLAGTRFFELGYESFINTYQIDEIEYKVSYKYYVDNCL
ncbi:MAG: hypothetical protein ACEPOV_11045 [Hyphomicrobiales bacterium]